MSEGARRNGNLEKEEYTMKTKKRVGGDGGRDGGDGSRRDGPLRISPIAVSTINLAVGLRGKQRERENSTICGREKERRNKLQKLLTSKLGETGLSLPAECRQAFLPS